MLAELFLLACTERKKEWIDVCVNWNRKEDWQLPWINHKAKWNKPSKLTVLPVNYHKCTHFGSYFLWSHFNSKTFHFAVYFPHLWSECIVNWWIKCNLIELALMPGRAEHDHNANWLWDNQCDAQSLETWHLYSVRKLEATLTELQYHTEIVMQKVQ